MNCYYFNAQSLRNKLKELCQLLHDGSYDIVSVSETWFSPLDLDSIILDGSGYDVIRGDRRARKVNGDTKPGGGVCFFIRSSIKFKTVVSKSGFSDFIDFLCVDIIGFENNYRLMTCYIPPVSCGLNVNILCEFLDASNVHFICDSTIILMGDFNFPNITWSPDNLIPVEYHSSLDATFVNFVLQHALQQFMHLPTRGNNILDLVFSDDPFAVCNIEITQPFSSSDHNAITFQLLGGASITSQDSTGVDNSCTRYNFKRANWECISDALAAINWNNVMNSNNVDRLWDVFYETLFGIIDKYVPKVCPRKARSANRKFYPKPIRILQNRKLAIWKKLQSNRNNITLKQKYVAIAKKCRIAIHDYYAEKENLLVESDNLGKFYKYVNRKLAVKTGIGILKSDNGVHVTNPLEQAEMFSKYFATTFVDDNGVLPDFPSRVPTDTFLANITFSMSDVSKKLSKLRIDAASGPDNLPPIFL